MRNATDITPNSLDRAGWRIREWVRAVGIARSTYYALPADRAPSAVIVGGAHIVTESPAEWLQRVGKQRTAV